MDGVSLVLDGQEASLLVEAWNHGVLGQVLDFVGMQVFPVHAFFDQTHVAVDLCRLVEVDLAVEGFFVGTLDLSFCLELAEGLL